eukprot:558601-Pleurochrysis_carterae.AAC.2
MLSAACCANDSLQTCQPRSRLSSCMEWREFFQRELTASYSRIDSSRGLCRLMKFLCREHMRLLETAC